MDDPELARRFLTEVRQIPLNEEERETLTPELQTATDLEHGLL